MTGFACSRHLLVAAAMLGARTARAQEPAEPWVTGIGAPQYFAVLVADVDRSVAWYRAVFGLDRLGGSAAADGSWRIENLGNAQLLVEIIRDDRAQTVERARGFRKVGFRVPDVEEVADRVARATGERPRVLDFPPVGLRILQIRDPDGNIIQLSSRLERAAVGDSLGPEGDGPWSAEFQDPGARGRWVLHLRASAIAGALVDVPSAPVARCLSLEKTGGP